MNRVGLSDAQSWVSICIDANAGASHLADGVGSIRVVDLDHFNLPRLDFFKMDIEGFETRALRGARETIARLRPVMLIEVNEGALIRAGSSRNDLLILIRYLGYKIKITEPALKWTTPQYDVLCLP